jgi:hypothetical protein
VLEKPLPPILEPPLAVHNLAESKPGKIEPPKPIVIEAMTFDPSPILVTEVQVPPSQVISIPPVIAVQPQVPVEIKLPMPDLKVPDVRVTFPVQQPNECKPILPEPKKPVKQEVVCFGRKLATGEVVDGELLPPPDKPWNPDGNNKVVRWFDSKWKSDGNYELVNWCVFATHLELELRRL